MAPAAARRAKAVQRTHSQGLRGNPDACRPGRGSAFSDTARKTGGNARPVSALPVQPTAAMNPRLGGAGGTPPAPSFPPFLWEEMGAPAAQARPRGGGIPGRQRGGASGMPRPTAPDAKRRSRPQSRDESAVLSWCHPCSERNSAPSVLLLREGNRARLRARW